MWWTFPVSATVDIWTGDNETFQDAWQFQSPTGFTGASGSTGFTGPSWNFVNQNFRFDIKTNREEPTLVASLTSAQGQIVVYDPIGLVLGMNVPEATWGALGMIPGSYIYELMMFTTGTTGVTGPGISVRVPLMHGNFNLVHGIAEG